MKLNKLKVVLLVVLVAVLASSAVWAKSGQISVTVPHDFMVGETKMPEGKYLLERGEGYPPIITVRSTSGGGSSIVHVITTLARTGMEEQEAKLVFDKSNGEFELSEVWFAGEDGYLVCGTVAPHSHDVVNAE
jgi:hypothetical protein